MEGEFLRYCQELDLLTKKESATEECLLSAMALNLKRMVKAIFSAMLMDKIWAENMFSQPIFCLCQQVPYSTLSQTMFLFRFYVLTDKRHSSIKGA